MWVVVGGGGMWANTETSRSSAEAGASTTMSIVNIYILSGVQGCWGASGRPCPGNHDGQTRGKESLHVRLQLRLHRHQVGEGDLVGSGLKGSVN